MLLIAAGLFLRTLQNLRNVDVGFNTRNLVVFRVNPSLNRYDESAIASRSTNRCSSGLRARGRRALGGALECAAAVGRRQLDQHLRPGRSYGPTAQRDSINRVVMSPGFFETMEMPLRLGRDITDRDDQKAPKVVIINETAARKYFPNENPIGKRFGTSVETAGQMEIVGILRDAKYDSVRDAVPPTMYVPHLQWRMPSAIFHVRTAGDPPAAIGALREAVQAIDPNLPLDERLDTGGARRAAACSRSVSSRRRTPVFGAPGAAARVGRPVRLDVLQRRAAHQRNRHPHGARRAAAATCCGW